MFFFWFRNIPIQFKYGYGILLVRENDSISRFLHGSALILFMFKAIGAEYGEGFETFRQDGPVKVDVVSEV